MEQYILMSNYAAGFMSNAAAAGGKITTPKVDDVLLVYVKENMPWVVNAGDAAEAKQLADSGVASAEQLEESHFLNSVQPSIRNFMSAVENYRVSDVSSQSLWQ